MIFDTDVLIWFFRGNTKAARTLELERDRSLSIVSLMELYQGARSQTEIGDGIQIADALIAATARETASILVTGNIRHFRSIAALQLKQFRPA